jgi:hypothetical protein
VPFGLFILEVIQCHQEYLYWRSSSAILVVMRHVWCIRHSRSLPLFFMLE